MRKSPQLLALFLILITFFRVSGFLAHGIMLGAIGYAFAIAITAGVFVSGYFTGFKETKTWGIILLIAFGVTDLFFNELEMIRTLAPETLIGNGSNFLGFNADALTKAMHIAAVAYGALPTLLAGGLGVLQGEADKVASLNKRSIVAQIWYATKATLLKGLNATLAERFGQEYFAPLHQSNSSNLLPDGQETPVAPTKVRWEDLLATDKDAVATLPARQLMARYGISKRTVSNWKQRVASEK